MLSALGNAVLSSGQVGGLVGMALPALFRELSFSRKASSLAENIDKWEQRARKELKGVADPYKALTHKTLDVSRLRHLARP